MIDSKDRDLLAFHGVQEESENQSSSSMSLFKYAFKSEVMGKPKESEEIRKSKKKSKKKKNNLQNFGPSHGMADFPDVMRR